MRNSTLGGEVISVSAKGYRFTVRWYDETEEKFSKADLQQLLKPLPSSPRVGSEYQAVLPAASKRSAADCTDLPSKSQAVALLPSKKAELERTIADLREEIKSHTEKSTTLATHQSELKVQNEQLADRCQGLRIQVEQMTRQIEQLRVVEKRAAELKGLLDSTRVDLARASGELSNLDGTDGLQKGVKKIMLRCAHAPMETCIPKADMCVYPAGTTPTRRVAQSRRPNSEGSCPTWSGRPTDFEVPFLAYPLPISEHQG